MKKLLLSKRGLGIGILALSLVAVIALGGSLAYFTDSDEVTNTFTMGKVDVALDEPGWEEDDGLDLLPGNVRTKDPTITAEAGQSYMRLRLEIVDGEDNLITDPDRIDLILHTLFYDSAYGTQALNIEEGEHYLVDELQELIDAGKIDSEYNHELFAFAGIEQGKPGVRYYNYIGGEGGIFDADVPDIAVLFTNVVIPRDWQNQEIFGLNGDTYAETPTGGLEVETPGTGYKLIIKAEAIQASEMDGADDAFAALDELTGVVRDTSGI